MDRSLLFNLLAAVVFCLSAQSASALTCGSVHREITARQSAEDLLESISQLEMKIDSIRKNWNGSYQRSTVIQSRHNRSMLLASLESGDASTAVGIYRQLFRDVELAYWRIREGNRETRFVKAFGEGYGEYYATRSMLERLSQDQSGSLVGKTSQRVLENLGVQDLTQFLPGLAISGQRPSLLQIRKTFNQDPQFLLIKLRKDLAEEKRLAFKAVPLRILHVESLRQMVYRFLPEKFRQPVSQVIGLSYNSYVLGRYLPEIERMLLNPSKDAKVLTAELKELSGKYKEEDFLLTFARIASAADLWKGIKGELEKSKESSRMDAALLERMNSIEERAAKLGYLPRFEQNSLVDSMIEAAIPLGTTIYLAHEASPTLIESINQLSLYLSQF